MIALVCPVRGCGRALERRDRALACAGGHTFDRARSGYYNLLQPQDRRSARPGDPPAAVAARSRWLEAGRAEPLARALEESVAELRLPARAVLLDAGCGDGYFLDRLVGAREWEPCGIDLSVEAIRRAARRRPSATWLVANADRTLPAADDTVDLALSLFGRRHAPELQRVLRPAGRLLVALPAEDDLLELRAAVQGAARRVDRVPAALAALGDRFALVARRTVRWRLALDRGALADLLALSYRGARARERARSAPLAELEVTQSAELLLLAPASRSIAGRRGLRSTALRIFP